MYKIQRFRRTADKIVRRFRCSAKDCGKSYGSEGSLKQHLKLKHPEIYKEYAIKEEAEEDENEDEDEEEEDENDDENEDEEEKESESISEDKKIGSDINKRIRKPKKMFDL